eukprot:TRINITY_DN3610_c0_g1_i2.p1 TRINITY_DN3610_c0_g1~~TRINITY_DN3610_c0_g1_i2.p1  ORF type:complete len:182 (+),score=35.49 TRINITY_DN3610_c0_g1_i2:55-546(+)
MLRSLVGSEMCIRDSYRTLQEATAVDKNQCVEAYMFACHAMAGQTQWCMEWDSAESTGAPCLMTRDRCGQLVYRIGLEVRAELSLDELRRMSFGPAVATCTSELEECYQRMLQVQEAVLLLNAWGVQRSEDLHELDVNNVVQLSRHLKKVLRLKLVRSLKISC